MTIATYGKNLAVDLLHWYMDGGMPFPAAKEHAIARLQWIMEEDEPDYAVCQAALHYLETLTNYVYKK